MKGLIPVPFDDIFPLKNEQLVMFSLKNIHADDRMTFLTWECFQLFLLILA